MLVTRATRVTNIPWHGQAATSRDHCQWQIIVRVELSLTRIQTPKYKVQSSCWLMIEIFGLARLPHAQVRACCARLVAGGWSTVINVQTVGLFTRVSSCPAVQPPLLSIISTFGIIMQNDGFAERWICRPFPGVRVAAIAARRGLTPQHLVRDRYSSNIHQHQTVNILC